jgi:hypothetical protein
MQEHRKRTVPEDPQSNEPAYGIFSWYSTHRRILHFAANLPVARYMRIRAEDVLNDSESQLRAIVHWLGVRHGATAIHAMQHPEASPFACFNRADSGISGGNDPGFLQDPIPRRAEIPFTLEPPEGWVAEPRVWDMVIDLANCLGYFDERLQSR